MNSLLRYCMCLPVSYLDPREPAGRALSSGWTIDHPQEAGYISLRDFRQDHIAKRPEQAMILLGFSSLAGNFRALTSDNVSIHVQQKSPRRNDFPRILRMVQIKFGAPIMKPG
ncbi:predicted protein [Histoplasma capsulatum G186AR]|uniref:Uncharacterized protein n=1 Tax=Ajellomyces capsulatus (strain G186AR / H82 / ATCC MYA-2454 / RMSCC 2432) TaxID=447093 RepID=C0NC35_AJECG|nr:uncharacterized protein HCBG_00681 [Histoplasma capsulatum G186AR]EEH11226.1 predicted protein [Histoplasma capsulatum G186AR]